MNPRRVDWGEVARTQVEAIPRYAVALSASYFTNRNRLLSIIQLEDQVEAEFVEILDFIVPMGLVNP